MKLKEYPRYSTKHHYEEKECQAFEKAFSQLESLTPEAYAGYEKAMNDRFESFEAGYEISEMARMMIKNRSEQDEAAKALQSVTLELETLRYDFEKDDSENLNKLLNLYLAHQQKFRDEKEKLKGGKTSSAFRKERQIVNYLAHLVTERTLSANGLYRQP